MSSGSTRSSTPWARARSAPAWGLLKPDGVYVSSELGPSRRERLVGAGLAIPARQEGRFPLPRIDQTMVRRFGSMMAAGTFRPLIDRTFPLEDIVAAYDYVEAGQKIGSVVLTVAAPTD